MKKIIFLLILMLSGCGSPQQATVQTVAATPVTYVFVDDSFATESVTAKPVFDDTKSVVVEAKDCGDGSLTGETIKAAIDLM
jgi:uncharacterized protein YcfL